MNRAALPEELQPASAFHPLAGSKPEGGSQAGGPATPAPGLRDIALGMLGALLDDAAEPGRTREPATAEAQFLRDAWHYCLRHGTGLRSFQGERSPWISLVQATMAAPARADAILSVAQRKFELGTLDLVALALVSAVEDDALVGRVLAWMQAPQAGSRPTLALLARALAPLMDSRADDDGLLHALDETRCLYALAHGTAVQAGMLVIDDDRRPLCERSVRMTPRMAAALAGVGLQETSAGRNTLPPQALLQLPAQHGALATALDAWAERLAHAPKATLIIRSGAGIEARAAAAALAQRMHLQPVWMNMVPSGATSASMAESMHESMNEGTDAWLALTGCVPVFTLMSAPGEVLAVPPLRYYTGPVLVVNGLDGGVQRDDGPVAEWRVPAPDEAARLACWAEAGHEDALATTAARRYRAGYAQVVEHARLAQLLGNVAEAATMTSAGRALDALAQHMPELVPDDALIVSAAVRADLHRVVQRCEAREHLHDRLGPAARTRANAGVRVLFTGASGTGKSLAAQWVAAQLGLPIFRVDLAAMLSKWIGDTEKNLSELLARAEHADAVLLFDEADTLFGKRTEVNNANDRFANAQTNYLLQRIETHAGIVVLTSNSRARFDAAFTRRLDFIVDFSAPDAAARRALWLAHAGEQTQCSHADFNRLAALSDLAGGHIRNAVLSAAAAAHAAQRTIGYADLADGVRVEYRKLGRTPPQEL